MNNKKCVIYSDKSIVNTDNVDNDVFYLDDYLLPPSNRMARVMTENIFENEKKWTKGNWHKGFNLSWIVYDKVFSDALVVTSLKNIIDEVSNYQTIDVTTLDHKYGVIIERYLFDKKVILRKKE